MVSSESLYQGAKIKTKRRRTSRAEEEADQDAQDGEGSGAAGEGPSNIINEPHSRATEQPGTQDEMREQDGVPRMGYRPGESWC